MRNILRGLKIAMMTLLFGTSISIVSTISTYADVIIWDSTAEDELLGQVNLSVTNTISKDDAIYFTQHAADFEKKRRLNVELDSTGGDVDAALQIGRIIRGLEASVQVYKNKKCFSSCALIYIAGVTRTNLGTIGLHRPYLASAPLSQQEIERQYPMMLQKIKEYVQSMGVTDSFYQEMVNTEPSNIHLYRATDINKLVPDKDPTYDEIETSYDARRYGIDTAEMRRRSMDTEKCSSLYPTDSIESVVCNEAIRWGLSERVYRERVVKWLTLCKVSDEDRKAAKEAGRRLRDLPLELKHEACVRNIMLGR